VNGRNVDGFLVYSFLKNRSIQLSFHCTLLFTAHNYTLSIIKGSDCRRVSVTGSAAGLALYPESAHLKLTQPLTTVVVVTTNETPRQACFATVISVYSLSAETR